MYLELTPKEFEESEDQIEEIVYENTQFQQFKSSILKLSYLQVLSKGVLITSNDPETFIRNESADKLNDLINKVDQGETRGIRQLGNK
ncbi:hypothetical protein [Alkalihalophilus marmarensis]|uniref:hypothetical protein n=1 Tax=Alkalihalophilus marmarensis TaxID=521377 RepID=UPI002E232922|nr:hypothetical protein [Alkalihalophilus marmarensis]